MLAVVGCGGVTKFSDTTAIAIKGPAMPPPAVAAAPKRVEVKDDRIELNEKIQFALAEATILPESHSLLNEVVAAINEHKNIGKVDIIGHTSDEGADAYNLDLSQKRAKAVGEYLTSHGVDAGRLQSKGLGETQPIADNATAAGREKNRRVEFLIIDANKAAEEKPAVPEKKKAEGKKSAKAETKPESTTGGAP